MDYVNVDTTGNAIDFGDLTYANGFINKGGAASRTVVYSRVEEVQLIILMDLHLHPQEVHLTLVI